MTQVLFDVFCFRLLVIMGKYILSGKSGKLDGLKPIQPEDCKLLLTLIGPLLQCAHSLSESLFTSTGFSQMHSL